MSSIKVADVGPTTVSCYTTDLDENESFVYNTEEFVHRWTITGFKEKMKKFEHILSERFQIGNTIWSIVLWPAGVPGKKGWVAVKLCQLSEKSVKVKFDFLTGISESMEFIKACHFEEEWADGYVKGLGELSRFGENFVSHEEINNMPILKDGCLQLITRITISGDVMNDPILKEQVARNENVRRHGWLG